MEADRKKWLTQEISHWWRLVEQEAIDEPIQYLVNRLSNYPLSEEEIQDKLSEYTRRINKKYSYYSVRERSGMIEGYEAALKDLTKPKEVKR